MLAANKLAALQNNVPGNFFNSSPAHRAGPFGLENFFCAGVASDLVRNVPVNEASVSLSPVAHLAEGPGV